MKLNNLLRYRSRSKLLEKIAREIRFRAERLHIAERRGLPHVAQLRRSLTLAVHRLCWQAENMSRIHSRVSIDRKMKGLPRP